MVIWSSSLVAVTLMLIRNSSSVLKKKNTLVDTLSLVTGLSQISNSVTAVSSFTQENIYCVLILSLQAWVLPYLAFIALCVKSA